MQVFLVGRPIPPSLVIPAKAGTHGKLPHAQNYPLLLGYLTSANG
jgi:hypothetical protein